MKTNPAVTFALAMGVFLLLSACDEVTFKKKEMLGVKRVLLVSMKVTNNSLDEDETVKYPNLNFLGEDLRTNLASEWNNRFGDRLTMVLVTNAVAVPLLADDRFFYVRGNVDTAALGAKGLTDLCQVYRCQAYALLEGGVSAWGQELSGRFQVVKPGGEVAWTHRFRAVSPYIIKDEASPYLSDFDQILDTLERQRSHRGELLNVAADLGRSAATRWYKAWEGVFGKPGGPPPKAKAPKTAVPPKP